MTWLSLKPRRQLPTLRGQMSLLSWTTVQAYRLLCPQHLGENILGMMIPRISLNLRISSVFSLLALRHMQPRVDCRPLVEEHEFHHRKMPLINFAHLPSLLC